jgi:alpha-L-rhamnosidase
LGRDEERARFAAIAQAEKEAILEQFYDPQTKSFDSDTQFCLSFALKLKLIPQKDVPQVLEKLIKDIRDHGYHLTTGILGTRYVMEVLRDHDQQETAMKLILQKDYPSWLDIIRERTTLSERWDGRGSQNHCMFGSVDGIFYSMLAGIQVDEQIVIDPYPAKELNRVQAKVCFGDGAIEVSWKRQEEKINLSIDITGSREALFGGQTLTAGHYDFTL